MANKRKRSAERYSKIRGKTDTPATVAYSINHWVKATDLGIRPEKTTFIQSEDLSLTDIWEVSNQLNFRRKEIQRIDIPITNFERKMNELYKTVGIKSEYEVGTLDELERDLFISQSKKLLEMRDATQIGAWNTYQSDLKRFETFKYRHMIDDDMSFTNFRDMLFFMSENGYQRASKFYASSQLIENITELGNQYNYDWGKIKDAWKDFETGQASAGDVVLRRIMAQQQRKEREKRGEE